MKIILPFLILFITLTGCKREEYEDLGPLRIPFPVLFVIKENNQRLSDATLNRLKLVYFEGGNKNYIRDFTRGTDEFDSLGVMSTLDVGFLSANDGIKDYYLEYPNGDLDTLYIDYKYVSSKDSFNNSCYCSFPLEELRFNGKFAPIDTSIKVYQVYLFNK